jgi:antitoxin component YwqK of YwqJK toxin-antitoxin module
MKIYQLIFLAIAILGCSENENSKIQSTIILEKYSNGTTKIENIYPDRGNVNDYLIKEYYQNGNLSFESKVHNHNFIEYKKSYYENGKISEFTKLKDSADFLSCCPDGFYQIFYENGNIQETHYKKDGLINGLVVAYDSLGRKTGEYNILSGVKNGLTKYFYANGKIESIENYLNDTLIKTAFYFKENGDSLKRNFTYKGKIDFPIKYWNENGFSLEGISVNKNSKLVKWIWRDSANKTIKEKIVKPINNKFITPDF